MTLLEASNVRKLYGEYCALDGVSLSVGDGEFVSIIGPTAPARPRSSRPHRPPSSHQRHVRFKGADVAGRGPVRWRAVMARSFQLVSIFPGLTVAETIAVAVVSRLGRGAVVASLGADRRSPTSGTVAELFGPCRSRRWRARCPGRQEAARRGERFALNPDVIRWTAPERVSTRDKTAIMETLVQASGASA